MTGCSKTGDLNNWWNQVLGTCIHAQPSPTLCDPMDCSPPGSSVHGMIPGKHTGVSCHFLLQGSFPTQSSNPSLLQLLHWQADSVTVLPGKPRVPHSYPLLRAYEWEIPSHWFSNLAPQSTLINWRLEVLFLKWCLGSSQEQEVKILLAFGMILYSTSQTSMCM